MDNYLLYNGWIKDSDYWVKLDGDEIVDEWPIDYQWNWNDVMIAWEQIRIESGNPSVWWLRLAQGFRENDINRVVRDLDYIFEYMNKYKKS